MLPAFLIRVAVDSVRHDPSFKDSNPYTRCEESNKLFMELWNEQFGHPNNAILEPALVTSYWSEFFHCEDPLPDEREWRDGLSKRSSQYDSFDQWQEWFKKSYAKVYKDNNIWMCVLMTAWAHTHQYEVRYTDDAWEFKEAKSYLPTTQLWRLEPHINVLTEVLRDLWLEELKSYSSSEFTINEQTLSYLGKIECLGFDTKRYTVVWPSRSTKEPEILDLGDMVADVIAPAGDNWYRQLDNIIFANDHVDMTALVNRVWYVLESRRRLFELSVDKDPKEARMQASAEGWLVQELEEEEEEAVAS
jgi:hypothetical protein